MRVCTAALAIGLVAGASLAFAAQPATLHSISAVRALTHAQAAQQLPVDLDATVTYARLYEKTLFIQQGDFGIYVYASTKLMLAPGDHVHVRGVTNDSFNPIVVSNDIALLGNGPMPEPIPVTFSELIRAQYDCRWVKAHGTVALVERGTTSGRPITHLVLTMNGGTADIILESHDPAPIEQLPGAEIELAAVAGEQFDGKMQQTGVRLHVPSLDFVRVLKPSPADPWSAPLTPMDKVLHEYRVEELSPRIRVEGVLTYYLPGESAILQDGTKSIRVLTSQIDSLRLGDKAEAIGIPYVEDGFLTLKLGRVRTVGAGAMINPERVTWDNLATGKYSFNLVSIEGTIVSQVQEHARDVYIVSTGKQLFSASLRNSLPYVWPQPVNPPPMREIPVGSRVRITGVAALEHGNPYNGPIAFSILLRSANEISVIANPSWLSVRHLTEVVVVLLLLVFAMIVRAWLVERRARRKIAHMAALERQRSRIMELINTARPLEEILEEIANLAFAALKARSTWCQLNNGTLFGKPSAESELRSVRVADCAIPSRSGETLGNVFAAFPVQSEPRELEAAVLKMAAGLASLAIETSQLYSDLVRRSEYDVLTNVQNRFSMEKFIEAQIVAMRQSAGAFGLLYLDLDKFKRLNDEHGHHVGDLYLQQVARRIKRQLRPGDMLARLGGDEFAVLIPRVSSRSAMEEIAHRVQQCFEESFVLNGIALRGSASVGVALYPEDGTTKESLLIAADSAMYVAKHTRYARAVAV